MLRGEKWDACKIIPNCVAEKKQGRRKRIDMGHTKVFPSQEERKQVLREEDPIFSIIPI